MVAAGCCAGGAEGGLGGCCAGGCASVLIALCSLIAVGMATCLQVVIIAFAWKYAFPGEVAPTIAPASAP